MLEHGELSVEQLIGLADWDAERKPVTSGSDRLGGDAILSKPRVDRLNGFLCGSNEGLNLSTTYDEPCCQATGTK